MGKIKVKKSSIAHYMNLIDDIPYKDQETLMLARKLYNETMFSINTEREKNQYSNCHMIDKQIFMSVQNKISQSNIKIGAV